MRPGNGIISTGFLPRNGLSVDFVSMLSWPDGETPRRHRGVSLSPTLELELVPSLEFMKIPNEGFFY